MLGHFNHYIFHFLGEKNSYFFTPSLILVRYSVMSKAHIMLIILIHSIVIISTTPPTIQRYLSNLIHLKHRSATSISDVFFFFLKSKSNIFIILHEFQFPPSSFLKDALGGVSILQLTRKLSFKSWLVSWLSWSRTMLSTWNYTIQQTPQKCWLSQTIFLPNHSMLIKCCWHEIGKPELCQFCQYLVIFLLHG